MICCMQDSYINSLLELPCCWQAKRREGCSEPRHVILAWLQLLPCLRWMHDIFRDTQMMCACVCVHIVELKRPPKSKNMTLWTCTLQPRIHQSEHSVSSTFTRRSKPKETEKNSAHMANSSLQKGSCSQCLVYIWAVLLSANKWTFSDDFLFDDVSM